MSKPFVVILILNWNGWKDTLECLDSLKLIKYSNYKIIVVDNGSTDESLEKIKTACPELMLIENDHNFGYAGGINLGVDCARKINPDYLLLLNNDTLVSPEFLDVLIDAAEADPQNGVIGPKIYYSQEPDVIWSAGGSIDQFHGSTKMVGINEKDIGQFDDSDREVDFVTGCAFLIKTSVIDKVGDLDNRFFAYYEETEWCVRIRKSGFKIIFSPKAHIWHKISPIAREESPFVSYLMTRNRLLFIKLTRLGWRATFFALVEDIRTILSMTIRPKWRNKRNRRDAMLLGLKDYFAGCYGKGSF